jgi:hypothetical protein
VSTACSLWPRRNVVRRFNRNLDFKIANKTRAS